MIATTADQSEQPPVVVAAKTTTKKRRKSNSKADREIKAQQNSTSNIIPHAPFQRIVHEIADEIVPDIRFRRDALDAIQVEAEQLAVTMFTGANMLAAMNGRETVHAKDIQMFNRINKM